MNLGAIITIIIVVAWVVKGLSSVMGNQEDGEKKRPGRSLEEWDELQANRRDAMADQRQDLQEVRTQSAAQNPAQMTMAERIELARQRARQQAGLQPPGDEQAEALKRARAQAQRQAQQQRDQAEQLAQRERAAKQEQAARERAQQQRRQRAQQAEQDAQQRRQRRTQPSRRTNKPRPTQATTGSQREKLVAESMKRVHKGHGHAAPVITTLSNQSQSAGARPVLGKMNRKALRHAFIMKELLDKPIALRDPQADLL